ncbi:asparagine synthetase domain-containing protein 1 [Nannizzia gypsea CBS 118893]|uniref:Asparagine synthetase domain-containing protein 1 n=1 Tax=Arthroderma gypseum (strain ATCC MYA-4604 / CBS 118893) TaxID=535722 RepID=E4UU12_ARTGP|nr:asparagine synthetase domain-containing protein 1 [Nannizzia gypsea CBS 118893]EFR01602.1 asparagine synthetase domain-containing protein 1 [Nannizzia gypsea CBS 118893]
MCGIFFSLSNEKHCYPDQLTEKLIRNRGPDSYQTECVCVSQKTTYLTFASSVLGLRGDSPQKQPLVDDNQLVLCWNGEVWKFADRALEGNDTSAVFRTFMDAVKPCNAGGTGDTLEKLCAAINNISGPFSFVFYDSCSCRVFYGRDYLGRRSLLHGWSSDGCFRISSIRDETLPDYFEEVDTTGIHVIDLASQPEQEAADAIAESPRCPVKISVIPWSPDPTSSLKRPIPAMNISLPEKESISPLAVDSPCIGTLREKLLESLRLRLVTIPGILTSTDAKVAVLFSGGLDCTLLARLAHDILPKCAPIDLLNVAFENPRVVAAAAKNTVSGISSTSVYDDCPDRRTGISSFQELKRVCPGRVWRFVRINVPYSETTEHRPQVKHLMAPHNTEMDLSIACALYFASRGRGICDSGDSDGESDASYTTPARVLLSGLGADEVFAGYSRHAIAFSRHGFRGLIDEVQLDVGRLGKRNLGRDDRVISHWGKEARYPYLDEDFLTWALSRPIWEKCGFGCEKTETELVPNVEDGKKALRLVAWTLGMQNVAMEKKRAIQFGSRTAKMESGRSRGTQVLD